MNLPKQLIKQIPKQQFINAIKAVPDSIITITFIENDKTIVLNGKATAVQIQSII